MRIHLPSDWLPGNGETYLTVMLRLGVAPGDALQALRLYNRIRRLDSALFEFSAPVFISPDRPGHHSPCAQFRASDRDEPGLGPHYLIFACGLGRLPENALARLAEGNVNRRLCAEGRAPSRKEGLTVQ